MRTTKTTIAGERRRTHDSARNVGADVLNLAAPNQPDPLGVWTPPPQKTRPHNAIPAPTAQAVPVESFARVSRPQFCGCILQPVEKLAYGRQGSCADRRANIVCKQSMWVGKTPFFQPEVEKAGKAFFNTLMRGNHGRF